SSPPRPLGRRRFYRRIHTGVGYQQRKNWESCDSFSPPSSIGGESADAESLQARVSYLRRQILSLEDGLGSSLHPLKGRASRTRHEFLASLPKSREEHALPRRH